MAEFLLVTGKENPATTVKVLIDGEALKNVDVSWQNVLELDNAIRLDGSSWKPGLHRIALKKGDGPLFYSLRVKYLIKPNRILAAGNGIHIERRYFRLPSKPLAEPADQRLAADLPKRKPLADGDTLAIGDLMEVELTISSDEFYEYLAFEDPKPAGCEPVQVRSGYTWGDGLCANVELRDQALTFFVGWLPEGQHRLRYRLRAETTGKFHALSATGFAMYTPEIHARSEEMQLGIEN